MCSWGGYFLLGVETCSHPCNLELLDGMHEVSACEKFPQGLIAALVHRNLSQKSSKLPFISIYVHLFPFISIFGEFWGESPAFPSYFGGLK